MVRSCLLCGSVQFQKVFDVPVTVVGGSKVYSLQRCGGCGLLRTHPWPENPETLYVSNYHEERRPRSRRFWECILPKALYGIPVRLRSDQFLRVLDFGCGTGEFLDSLSDTAWERWGYDISEFAAAQVPAGVRMVTGQLKLPRDYFDAIFTWEVLEHLPDPLTTLRHLTLSLRPGGLFVASVPGAGSALLREFSADYFPLAVPYHLHHFDCRTPGRLLRRAGLTPVFLRRVAATLFVSRTLVRCLGRTLMNPPLVLRGLLRVFNLFGPSWGLSTNIVAWAYKDQ